MRPAFEGGAPGWAPHLAAVALSLAACGALAPVATAEHTGAVAGTAKAERRVVCAEKAALFAVPGDLVVGTVTRGDGLTVVERTANGRWAKVRARNSVRGWIAARHFCGATR